VTILLTPELEALIQAKIESGTYQDASEVIEAALRLLDDWDRLQRLRAALAPGLAQLERGEGRTYTSEVRAEIHRVAIEKARLGLTVKADVVP
jgi:antitoxin ParD1/3/4